MSTAVTESRRVPSGVFSRSAEPLQRDHTGSQRHIRTPHTLWGPLTWREVADLRKRPIQRVHRAGDVLGGVGGAQESAPPQEMDPVEEQGKGEVLGDRGLPLRLERVSRNVAEGRRIP